MNKKILSLAFVVLTGLFFLTVGVLTAADIPDEIMIDNKGYENDKKSGVKLSHKKHAEDYKLACTECHHSYKDGKNVWQEGQPVQKCSECHDFAKKQGNAKKLQLAYHNNCKDCHKALGQEGKPTGPYKKCNDCHK